MADNLEIRAISIKIIIFILFVCFTAGCEIDNKEDSIESITGRITSYSDCKNLKSKDSLSEVEKTQSCIEYNYDSNKKKLHLKHINAGFNCCPGNLYCEISSSNNTIIIQEFEENPLCNCDCLFDIEFEIDRIEKRDYYLKIIEPYCADQEKLFFELKLESNSSGIYCVIRNLYPWGVY